MSESSSVEKLLQSIHQDVRLINDRLFVGTERPSIQEDIATLKNDFGEFKAGLKEIKKKPRVPDNVWKAVAAVLVAIATAIGGYAGLKSSAGPAQAAQGD